VVETGHASDVDEAAVLAADAEGLGLRETARGLRALGTPGARAGERPSREEAQAVLDTLGRESERAADDGLADALLRAKALLSCAVGEVEAGRLGPHFFEGIDRWREAARHFEEALAACGRDTSAARRAGSSVRLLRHLWLVETTMKPLEVRSFAAFVPLEGREVPDPEQSFLRAIHDFMEVEASYPVALRGAGGSFRCADSMLLRNAVAHGAVLFEPGGAVEADLFDREGDRPLRTLRLTARDLDDWFDRLELRIRVFAFLVALTGVLEGAPDGPRAGPSHASAWLRKAKRPALR